MSRENWIALNLIAGIEGRVFTSLISHFGSPSNVLAASKDELLKVNGISRKEADAVLSMKGGERLAAELEAIHKNSIKVTTLEDEDYPALLKEIDTPPPVLYVKGSLPSEFLGIAVVGTRKPSSYGLLMAERLVSEIAGSEIVTVSGMARGIDTAAHKAALAKGGFTIAVLGCGVDRVYPPENKKLYDEIGDKGGVISEFPMGTFPHKANFPRRNRIISGMSRAALIIEAGEKSGTLITARFALEQGRDVLAVPGRVTSSESRGTNDLIRKGARLVETFSDICEELDLKFETNNKSSKNNAEKNSLSPVSRNLSDEERRLLGVLSDEPLHIDKIVRNSGLPAGKASSILMKLEIEGLIRQTAGKLFLRL